MTDGMAGTAGEGSTHRLRAVAESTLWRAATGLLTAIRGASLLTLLALLLLSDGPVNPLRLIRFVAALCLLPGLAALVVRRLFRGELRVEDGALVFEQQHRRIEIPVASIVGVEPWLLPLPGSGLWLRLRSGERWRHGFEMEDPIALIDALVDRGASSQLGEAAKHPSLVYARARFRSQPRSWRRALFKFPAFALVPTIPLFRVHQIIAYGGTLGEYYQYGLGSYLAGFAVYWATLTIYLMLYAAVLRIPVELVAVGGALFAPRGAPRLRRVLDRLAAVFYYTAVPVAVILRFVPW